MSFDHRPVMSGERKDPLARLLRGGLWLASGLYRIGVFIRNRRYDNHPANIQSCGVPVISVGNLTTGGTGKTPVVCYLAKWFRQRQTRVAIVSRGYGRGEQAENDEALELHARLPDVPHVQDPDRVAAAQIAVDELDAQVILMDDGFQHRRLHRDLDIVVIDATCPFGYGYLLPRGLLREPIAAVKRADLVIVTRATAIAAASMASIESLVRRYNRAAPILHTNHQATGLLEFPSQSQPIATLQSENVAVVCGIGNPAAFTQTVTELGAKVVDSKIFPDHDPYSPETFAELRNWVEKLGDQITRVVCTHKDLVKLRTDRIGDVPVCAIVIELTLASDPAPLHHALEATLKH